MTTTTRQEHRTVRGGVLTYRINGGAVNTVSDQPRQRIDFTQTSVVNGDKIHYNPYSFTKSEGRNAYIFGQVTSKRKSDGLINSITTYSGSAGDSVVNNRQFLLPTDTSWGNSQSEADAKALAKLIDKLHNSDLNIAVTGLESPEVLKLKRQLAKAVSFKEVKRAFRANPLLGPATLVADAWLLWQYALKPTVMDAWAMATFGAHLASTPLQVRATGTAHLNSKPVTDSSNAYNYKVGVVKTKYCIDYLVDNPTQYNITRLGLSNPALIAWELLPFSFVADWFYNVGNYLQGIESAYSKGLKFISGFKTQTGKAYTVRQYLPYTWSDVNNVYSDNIQAQTTKDESFCNRVVLASFPSSRPPSVDLDLSSTQLLSGAALLQSIFLRR